MATKGQTDGISVSYEYTDAVVVVASASIMFNVGEALALIQALHQQVVQQ